MKVCINTRPAHTDFNNLNPWIDKVDYLRIWGGSKGMATYPPDVPQSEIDGLKSMQKNPGLAFIYMVNINDTLSSQLSFIQELITVHGLKIEILELGNEIYLPKFQIGDTKKLGVTRSWSVTEYVQLATEWAQVLKKQFNLPIYVLAASHAGNSASPGNDHQYRKYWNSAIKHYLNRPELAANIYGITFHRYAGEERTGATHEEEVSNASFDFLDDFNDAKGQRVWPIAITESGYQYAQMNEGNRLKALEFWQSFTAALNPETDIFGLHVLAARQGVTSVLSFGLFNENGRTPVGDDFNDFITKLKAPPAPPAPPEPEVLEPIITSVEPKNQKGDFEIWGKEKITFSDGTVAYHKLRFTTRLFGWSDRGLPKSQAALRVMEAKQQRK
jgi:hypothetical protein